MCLCEKASLGIIVNRQLKYTILYTINGRELAGYVVFILLYCLLISPLPYSSHFVLLTYVYSEPRIIKITVLHDVHPA